MTHMRFTSLLLLLGPAGLLAQDPPHLAMERADFADWLVTSPVSPYAAVYHQPLADELRLGPGADPPLDLVPMATLRQGRFRLTLEAEGGERTVPRNRAVALGEWQLRVSGERDQSAVTVFRPLGEVEPPGWYPYAADVVVEGALVPPDRSETRRMLALDGVTVQASLAGHFVGEMAGRSVRLLVYRMPIPGSEESELNIFFRDESNGNGTYTAGRFLALRPLGAERYLADFNRARNPFCAYNSVYPCPIPWTGNALPVAIEAGERYAGGGLEIVP